jgi:ribose transport system substrate-binding protein
MKKLLFIVIAALMALTLFACGAPATQPSTAPSQAQDTQPSEAVSQAPAEPEAPVVGISTGSSGTTWRNEMIDALKTVGDEYKTAGKIKDYIIQNNVTNGDATEQANIIRDFISSKVDIIMLNPNSSDALNGVIQEAQDAGILVVSFDATCTAPGIICVEQNQYDWNKKNVEAICEAVPSGNAIDVYGLEGHPGNVDRLNARDDVLKNYPDINIISQASGFWDQTKAKEAAAQMIGSGQQIDIAFTQDGMAYGVLSAFQDAGKLPKIMFGDPGTAFFKEWKKLRDEGADFKAVTQANPPGISGTAFRIALSLYNGKTLKDSVLTQHPDAGNATVYVNTTIFITDENFDEGWEMLKDKPDDYLITEIFTEDQVAELFN